MADLQVEIGSADTFQYIGIDRQITPDQLTLIGDLALPDRVIALGHSYISEPETSTPHTEFSFVVTRADIPEERRAEAVTHIVKGMLDVVQVNADQARITKVPHLITNKHRLFS